MDDKIRSLDVLRDVAVEYVAVTSLRPYKGNARTHSRKQIDKIATSISAFGFTNPVLVNDANGIIAGHGRVAAAHQIGLTEVPVLRIGHLSTDQIRAYIIADNRLAELAGWDDELLAIELQHLSTADLEFGVTATGFETPEIDLLIEGLGAPSNEEAEEVVLPAADAAPVSRIGDVWLLGGHRLICGDTLERKTFEHLMGDDRAQMIFTDPPYNVPIIGHVSGKGKVKHREFPMANGEMAPDAFEGFLRQAFEHLASFGRDGALHYICMDWRHMSELLAAAGTVYSEQKNLCVWAKTNGGMGSFYRSQHELVFVFKSGKAPHINNIDLGRFGRNRTNVWSYPGVNTFGPGRSDILTLHPTVKPVALIADAIRDTTDRGGIVLDAFCGSGSTVLAAERTGRRCFAIELDPLYIDTAIRRWQDETGEHAVLADGGISFTETAETGIVNGPVPLIVPKPKERGIEASNGR